VYNDHGNLQPDYVLLELKVAIYGKEAVKICRRSPQELAVLDSRPTHLFDGFDCMPRQLLTNALGNALVKQYAHALVQDRRLAAARPRQVHARR